MANIYKPYLSQDGTKVLGLYCQYTGVPFNTSKVTLWYDNTPMNDSRVDNAIFFKNLPELGGGYLRRDFDGVMNAKWFGIKADYDPIGLTGTDNTDAIQKLMDAARFSQNTLSKTPTTRIIWPEGRYAARYVNYYNCSQIGLGMKARFYALPSSETSFWRLADTSIPITRCEWTNIGIYGNAANTQLQDGFQAIALPCPTSNNTGGIWYSSWNNVEIFNFSGNQMYFECLDPTIGGIQYDMAHQFLTFNNVRLLANPTIVSRAFKSNGQFGQIVVAGNCNWDGRMNQATYAPGQIDGATAVEILGRPSSSPSDNVYSLTFDSGFTCQNSDIGVKISVGFIGVTFNQPYFENQATAVSLVATSNVTFNEPVFSNAGKGARIGATGEGSCVRLSNSQCTLYNPYITAGADWGVTNEAGSFTGLNIISNYNRVTVRNRVYQVGQVAGAIDVKAHKETTVNSSATPITTINSTFAIGAEITLNISDSSGTGALAFQRFATGGNIGLPYALTEVFFRSTQPVKFRFNGDNWIMTNPYDAFDIMGSGLPEGVYYGKIGTRYTRVDGVSTTPIYYKISGDGTNTGWVALVFATQLPTKMNKGLTATDLAVSGTTLDVLTFSDVRPAAANNTIQTLTSSFFTAGDLVTLRVWAGVNLLQNPYLRFQIGGNLSVGGYDRNNGIIIARHEDVLTFKVTNSGTWVCSGAPGLKSLATQPNSGYYFLNERFDRLTATGNREWVVSTEGYAGQNYNGAGSYVVGNNVSVGGNTYTCTVAGATANTPPSGTSTTPQIDGGVTWVYLGVAAVFTAFNPIAGSNGATFSTTVTGINAKSTGATPLLTVPTGKSFITTRVITRVTASTAITAPLSASVGGAVTDDIMLDTSMGGLTAVSKAYGVDIQGAFTVSPAGQAVNYTINTAAVGTAQTVAVEIFGYYE